MSAIISSAHGALSFLAFAGRSFFDILWIVPKDRLDPAKFKQHDASVAEHQVLIQRQLNMIHFRLESVRTKSFLTFRRVLVT